MLVAVCFSVHELWLRDEVLFCFFVVISDPHEPATLQLGKRFSKRKKIIKKPLYYQSICCVHKWKCPVLSIYIFSVCFNI